MSSKGQLFSSDLVLAVLIFIIIIISSAWIWDTTKERIYLTESRNEMEFLSGNTVSVLVNTVG
ncbi:MAG: hypothetical protein ACQEP1_06470, partial [Nanobdellota archaeon]